MTFYLTLKKNLHMTNLVTQELKVWVAGPNFNDININDIFGDIFGDVFGTRSQSRRQRRGSDLQYNLELSLKEAVLGVQKKIKIPSHS